MASDRPQPPSTREPFIVVPPGVHACRVLNPPVQARPMEQPELSSDPDNIPPRSRLFLVVPKQADPQQLNVSRGY